LRRIIAITLSVLLWAFVRVTQEGNGSQSLSQINVQVQLQVRGVQPDLVAYDISQDEVRVTLRGDSESVGALREGFVKAYVDLTGLEGATNVWPEVKVIAPGGMSIVSQDPRSVNIKLSPMGARLVPVRLRVNGNPASGMAAGEPKLEPPQVRVTGPEALLQEVEEIVGRVVLDGQSQSFSVSLRDLVAVNSQGTEVQTKRARLKLSPESVSATIPVQADSRSVAVAVAFDNVKVVNAPGWRYRLEVEPEYVTLRVPRDGKAPKSLQIKAQTFASSTKPEVREVDLVIPDGVEVLGASNVRLRLVPEKQAAPESATPSPSPTATP